MSSAHRAIRRSHYHLQEPAIPGALEIANCVDRPNNITNKGVIIYTRWHDISIKPTACRHSGRSICVSQIHRIIAAVAIKICGIATEASWIGLEEAAHVGFIKAVAQVIKLQLRIPLLPVVKMAHARSREDVVIWTVDGDDAVHVIFVALQQVALAVAQVRRAAKGVRVIVLMIKRALQ